MVVYTTALSVIVLFLVGIVLLRKHFEQAEFGGNTPPYKTIEPAVSGRNQAAVKGYPVASENESPQSLSDGEGASFTIRFNGMSGEDISSMGMDNLAKYDNRLVDIKFPEVPPGLIFTGRYIPSPYSSAPAAPDYYQASGELEMGETRGKLTFMKEDKNKIVLKYKGEIAMINKASVKQGVKNPTILIALDGVIMHIAPCLIEDNEIPMIRVGPFLHIFLDIAGEYGLAMKEHSRHIEVIEKGMAGSIFKLIYPDQ